MDMPITKPSMVAYADELEFSQLIEELSKTKKNGFLRVTSGSEDGYLLFKDGKQVAASYNNLSKLEAIDKIKQAMEDYKTLVEVFDVRPSQVSYLMDLNKPYLLEKVLEIDEVLEELKKDEEDGLKEEEISKESAETPQETESDDQPSLSQETEKVSEDKVTTKPSDETPKVTTEPSEETTDEESTASDVAEQTVTAENSSEPLGAELAVEGEKTSTDPENNLGEESPSSPGDDLSGVKLESATVSGEASPETAVEASSEVVTESPGDKAEISEPETVDDFKTDLDETKLSGTPEPNDDSSTKSMDNDSPVEKAMEEPPETENKEPMDRTELLKKYGIKDIDEEDVEKVLESYTGGYLSDNDVEKVELTLMNRVKKSIMGLPKVKGTEVMIFLDNAGNDLRGNINVIMEYQSQGFLSRFVSGSKEINNLKRQVIGICNMEIRKIFREYPEVVDKFEINVEIS